LIKSAKDGKDRAGKARGTDSEKEHTDCNESEDETESEDEYSGKLGLKVETVEGLRFSDVVGVRIFEKDVLLGRL